jgi:hypothetical protein
MQFESRRERSVWTNTFLGLVPDFLIGAIVAYFTDTGLIGIVGTVLGLQLLYIVLFIKNFL